MGSDNFDALFWLKPIGLIAKFCSYYYANLNDLINFSPPEIIRKPTIF